MKFCPNFLPKNIDGDKLPSPLKKPKLPSVAGWCLLDKRTNLMDRPFEITS
jgi:hypothetical protein